MDKFFSWFAIWHLSYSKFNQNFLTTLLKFPASKIRKIESEFPKIFAQHFLKTIHANFPEKFCHSHFPENYTECFFFYFSKIYPNLSEKFPKNSWKFSPKFVEKFTLEFQENLSIFSGKNNQLSCPKFNEKIYQKFPLKMVP